MHTEFVDRTITEHPGGTMVTTFGTPKSIGGAAIIVTGGTPFEATKAMIAQTLIEKSKVDGIPQTEELLVGINEIAHKEAKQITDQNRSSGVPEIFQKLLRINKKKTAVTYAKSLTLSHKQLSLSITNIDQLGYTHQQFHKQYIPAELIPSDSELKAMNSQGIGPVLSPEASKFMTKTRQSFLKRKNVHGHLFIKEQEWHIIYFTFDDINAGAKGEKPHWVGGNHIHYVSHLWGVDRDATWSNLQQRSYSVSGAAHISYFDPRLSK